MAGDIFGPIHVAQIDKYLRLHDCSQFAKIKGAEGVSFGNDDERMGSSCRIIGIAREMNVVEHGTRRGHARWIIGADDRSLILQGLDHG